MTRDEIDDALYTACGVTQRAPRSIIGRVTLAHHPRAAGTFNETPTPAAVREFTVKVKRFLAELEDALTVQEVLELMDDAP